MIENSKFMEQCKALEHSDNFATIIAFQDYHEGRITEKELKKIEAKAGVDSDLTFKKLQKVCWKLGEKWKKEGRHF